MGWKGRPPITDGVKLPVINALYGAITMDKEIDLEERVAGRRRENSKSGKSTSAYQRRHLQTMPLKWGSLTPPSEDPFLPGAATICTGYAHTFTPCSC